MEKEQDIKSQEEQFKKEQTQQQSETKPEPFRMPEKDSRDFQIIEYNSKQESFELGRDIFHKLNPDCGGQGHVPVHTRNGELYIQTFKPETQTKPMQGGPETREKELGVVEIFDVTNPNNEKLFHLMSPEDQRNITSKQNWEYINKSKEIITSLQKEIQENPSPAAELRLSQIKTQVETYGQEMLNFRDFKEKPEKILYGLNALLASGSKDKIAEYYFHRISSEEEKQYCKDILEKNGVNPEQYFPKEAAVDTETFKEDMEVLAKPKEAISKGDIDKLIVDTGNYVTHQTNHPQELFRDGCLLATPIINLRAGKDISTRHGYNASEVSTKGIFFDKNKLYSESGSFYHGGKPEPSKDDKSAHTRTQNALETGNMSQSIAFVTHEAILASNMNHKNPEAYGIAYGGKSGAPAEDKSHELSIDLGLFFIPGDKFVDRETGYVVGWNEENIKKLEDKIGAAKDESKKILQDQLDNIKKKFAPTQEYWTNYFTGLVKEGKKMPDINKIVFYKGKLNEAITSHFKDKGMPSSPRLREKTEDLLIQEASKLKALEDQKK